MKLNVVDREKEATRKYAIELGRRRWNMSVESPERGKRTPDPKVSINRRLRHALLFELARPQPDARARSENWPVREEEKGKKGINFDLNFCSY